MTRPRAASETFVQSLSSNIVDAVLPIISPLIDIVALDATLGMAADDAAIFTSVNGVRLAGLGHGRSAYCVGESTTRAAMASGWAAIQSGWDAESLVAVLISLRPRQNLFHLSGRHTRGDVTARLTDVGINVRNVQVYDQRLCPLSVQARDALLSGKRVLVPLFSPRTASHFACIAPETRHVHAVALSQAVAEALGEIPLAGLTITDHPDAKGMSAALHELVCNTRL